MPTYALKSYLPHTSFLWLCSAVTSSPARGNFQQDVLPAHRASSPAAAGSFSLPPPLLSVRVDPDSKVCAHIHYQSLIYLCVCFGIFPESVRRTFFLTWPFINPVWKHVVMLQLVTSTNIMYLEHEFGCVKKMVGFPIKFHRL